MKNFIVTLTDDDGRTERAETVTAADFSAAYLATVYTNNPDIIILTIKEI